MEQQGHQDSQDREGESSNPSSSTPSEGSRFTFVLDRNQAGTRNHAMRAHWAERHKARRENKRKHESRKQLPRIAAKERSASQNSGSSSGQQDNIAEPSTAPSRVSPVAEQSPNSQMAMMGGFQGGIPGVPGQILMGLNHSLASTRLDPFDTFPIKLNVQHHKLIHHWLSTHATMMFDDMPASNFNPMKDVWFPLDLSNPASFNAIMAHSAAHLAHYYGGMMPTKGTKSAEALRFKADAVEILNQWVKDPQKALSNDAFAAVVRLLTFEVSQLKKRHLLVLAALTKSAVKRYWGTEDEWKIHRNGLEVMIRAIGGLHQLHNDWRLELVVGLVSLMSKPSWFESTNDLSEISEHNMTHSILGTTIDLQKLRCLWLISFIQDMRNLMGMSAQLYMEGLLVFPSLYNAVLLIRNNFEVDGRTPQNQYLAADYDRLACLFAISIIVQESVSLSYSAPTNELAILDLALQSSQDTWLGSVHNLRAFLHNHFINNYPNGAAKNDYVMQMTDVMSHLSLEAHKGIEKCLLNMLCRTRDGREPFYIADGGNPDALLSSVHGY